MAKVTRHQIGKALPSIDELRLRYGAPDDVLGSAFVDTRGKNLQIPLYRVRDILPNCFYYMEDGCFDITDIISCTISGAYNREHTIDTIYQYILSVLKSC